MESTKIREIVRNIIGKMECEKLFEKITNDISSKIVNAISLEERLFILDMYCFILLVAANSGSVELIGKYKISLEKEIFEITTEEIIKEYKQYINLIKNIRKHL